MHFIGTFFASLLALPFYSTQPLMAFGHRNYHYISSLNEYRRAHASSRPTIMMFSAPWCHACKHMEPGFNSVAGQHNHTIDFYIVNTDNMKSLIQECSIRGLPTIIFSRNGQELQRERGSMSKTEFSQSVHRFLATAHAPKPQANKKQAAAKPAPSKPAVVQETPKKEEKQAKKIEKKPEVKKVCTYQKPIAKKKHKKRNLKTSTSTKKASSKKATRKVHHTKKRRKKAQVIS